MTPHPAALPRTARPLWLLVLLSLLTWLAACSDSPPPEPVISVQPSDASAVAGTAATLSVTASGPDIGYQWQLSTDGGTTWANVAGATQASHTTAATTPADNGRRYRVVVSASGISLTSSAVTLTVTAAVVAPALTVQPAAQTATAPATATFSVTVTGTAPGYQWQRSTDNGATWVNIAGATAASYSTGSTDVSMNASQYRVVVSNSAGSVTSAAVVLSVTPTPIAAAISTQPADQSVSAGSAAAFTVAATGTPTPTLQWQRSTDNGATWANIAAATDATYNTGLTTLSQNGERYRALASNSAGTATSNAVLLTVNAAVQAPAITTQPASQSVTAPAAATFTAAASGVPTPAWQWQLSTDNGANWANVNGATAASYTTPATAVADSGRRYRAVASNTAGTATSGAAVLTVTAAPVAIAYEGFDYPVGVRLKGQNGGGGWAGAWDIADSAGIALDISQSGVIASGLRYTDSAGNDLLTSGGAWQTDANVAYGQALRATSASTGAGGSTRWVSFLVKQAAPSSDYNIAAATLGTGYVLGNGVMTGGLGSGLSPFLGCFLCTSSNTPIPGFAAGSVAMVLIRYDFTASGNDVVSLWINPPLNPATSLGTPTLSAAGNFAEVMNGLTLAWGNSRSFTFDELRIAATRDAAAPFTPAPSSAGTSVFFTDFETPLPPQIAAGTALIEGVQGFAGLGPTGNTIAGSMLRSETGNTVTITLTGLPPHSWLSLDFLFAAIDSLDGSGAYPSGDFFRVTLDGVDIFRESFANALASQIQSYVPPPGVQLARRVELGFWAAYPESAYWLGGDAIFRRIQHTGSSAVITMRIEGAGIQSLADESWAIENLRVLVGP